MVQYNGVLSISEMIGLISWDACAVRCTEVPSYNLALVSLCRSCPGFRPLNAITRNKIVLASCSEERSQKRCRSKPSQIFDQAVVFHCKLRLPDVDGNSKITRMLIACLRLLQSGTMGKIWIPFFVSPFKQSLGLSFLLGPSFLGRLLKGI